jgi:galactokinase
MLSQLQKKFRSRFQKEPSAIFFCPGRVNLIGEHIDYNGGKVMPCAISVGTWLAISKNTEKKLNFHSVEFKETASLHLQTSYTRSGKGWFNYPLGVINQLLYEGHGLSGLDMLYSGNLPIGAGLSSSASIEMVTWFALNELFDLSISRQDAALLCKKVENQFIGVNSGIMDQFAVAMGKKGKAILLNCDTLEHSFIPFETGDYSLAIINSNKKRELTESKYNERFAECGAALQLLKKELAIQNLCDIDTETFESNEHLINDPVLEKRARHVISENERVKEAAEALSRGKLERFGQLMYGSHQSLKELYEVTGKELDTIVDFCQNFEGCIGARMTGAGFGGCAIALIQKNSFEAFAFQLSQVYEEKIGYSPGVFAPEVVDGVGIVNGE